MRVYNQVNDNQTENLLGVFNENEVSPENSITLEDVEALFESIIDANRKKEEGVVYTPDYIVNHLISEALQMVPKSA